MSERMNPWHNARLMHAGANVLLAFAMLCTVAAGVWWLVQRPAFTLRAVSIEPAPGTELRHVSPLLLQATVQSKVRGNFFTVDLDVMRANFEAVPWVRRATVRRIWPDRLVVGIEEHRAIALWGDGRLINGFGELFSANLAEAEEDGPLPELAGPPASEQAVLARYRELHRWLAPVGRKPQSVELSQRYAWSVRLDDGTKLLLGRDQGVPIEERVTRWASVYPRVSHRFESRPEVIDLRYPNGFAVRAVANIQPAKPVRGVATAPPSKSARVVKTGQR